MVLTSRHANVPIIYFIISVNDDINLDPARELFLKFAVFFWSRLLWPRLLLNDSFSLYNSYFCVNSGFFNFDLILFSLCLLKPTEIIFDFQRKLIFNSISCSRVINIQNLTHAWKANRYKILVFIVREQIATAIWYGESVYKTYIYSK